jgi:6-phosphogluconolactonase
LLSGNELSNNVVVFKIDPTSGKLTRTGKEIAVETPVCIQFVPVQP